MIDIFSTRHAYKEEDVNLIKSISLENNLADTLTNFERGEGLLHFMNILFFDFEI